MKLLVSKAILVFTLLIIVTSSYSVNNKKKNATNTSNYTAKKGDTLWTIARKNNISYSKLCNLNSHYLTRPLKVGDKVILNNDIALSEDKEVYQSENLSDRSNTPINQKLTSNYSKIPVSGKILQSYRITKDNLHLGMTFISGKDFQIKALMAGKILYISNLRGYGYTVLVEHDENLISTYSLPSGKIVVSQGQEIKKGQILAIGVPPQVKVYFQIWQDNKLQNPNKWLKPNSMNDCS